MDSRLYVDGALGEGGGIPLSIAKRDGFTKFFVVLTRERSYVKPPYRGGTFFKMHYPRYPAIAEGIVGRADQYNSTRAELMELERQGRAIVVCPEHMAVNSGTRDVAALQACYEAGLEQSRKDVGRWKSFLNLTS